MSISLVINSCAGGPKAAETLSSGKQPHAQRAFVLRNFILPAALADPTFSEIIVVGEWEPGNGYIYIEVPSVHFSCVDALAQRQAGFERSKGDWVVFQHDDHMLDPLPLLSIGGNTYTWKENSIIFDEDVLIPSRYTRLRDVNGERLYSGAPVTAPGDASSAINPFSKGYISGHCAIYRREVLEKCPWGNVAEQFTWDVRHTGQIRAAGFSIEWSNALRCYDVEAGSHPWK